MNNEVDERRLNRFLEKKGHKKEIEAFKELRSFIEDSIKSGEVTTKDLLAGTAPAQYQKNYDNMIKYATRLDWLVIKHTTEAKSKGEEFEKEIRAIDAEIDNEDKYNLKPDTYEEDPEERNKLEQAREAYINNPNSENALNYTKAKINPSNLSPEGLFAKQDVARDDRHKRAMEEIGQHTIENLAKEEAKKEINRKRMITGENRFRAEREEALKDPRIKKNPTSNNPRDIDNKITARVEEIIAEG